MVGPGASPAALVRRAVPLGYRRRLAELRVRARVPTGRWRALPGLLVIGCQRGGTSSLYRYLGQHPAMGASIRKETDYLSSRFVEGERWYRAHFPLGSGRTGFEATPQYLLHPHAATRASGLVPDALIVAVLRDPVARAVSHHRHNVRLGLERLPLKDALAAEPDRLGDDYERMVADPTLESVAVRRYSYVLRSDYGTHLARWYSSYPSDRVLVLFSEDLFDDPQRSVDRVVRACGHEPMAIADSRNWSGDRDDASIPAAASDFVRSRLASVRADVATLTGDTPPWPVAPG